MDNVTPKWEIGQGILVALGSNQSLDSAGPVDVIALALRAIVESGLVIRKISRFFATPCFPAGAGPNYVNAVVSLQKTHAAVETLARLHGIETSFGRNREERWGMRTLDLDLLAVGDDVLPNVETQAEWRAIPMERQKNSAPDQLILPHPRIQDRAFVLVPLCDVAPGWVHPVLQQTAREMLMALPEADRAEVVPL